MIESIYGNQLEAILFTVNQYSDELLNEWGNRIDASAKTREGRDNTSLNRLMEEYPSLKLAFLYRENEVEILANSSDSLDFYRQQAGNILNKETEEIMKLKDFLENDYRKLQPIALSPGHVLVYFIGETDQKLKVVYGMIINAEKFINQTMAPILQEISQNQFYISIYNENKNTLIYNTDRNIEPDETRYTTALWLFPGYYAAIGLKEINISNLTRERSRSNILFILLVDLMLIIGIVLVFKSIDKQLKLAQLKSDFVSNVSHEIRTPLSLIQMYVESLKMNRVRPEGKKQEYLDVVLKETQRLSGMVNKILNFSQIEKNKKKYHFTPVNLNEIVDEVLTTFSHHLENEGFDYHIHLDQELPYIQADSEAVTDAMMNLIDNSIKYSPGEKYIEIQTGQLSGYVYFEVQDHGQGISEKDMKHIFDKFYRVTSSDLTPNTKGSGLGLNIVKHIMDAHGGDIRVHSKKGKGSRFVLNFPLIIDEKAAGF
ncbi:MAG: HAMP domain-containing sensor histidine kinase [Bacteroidales bacterium]